MRGLTFFRLNSPYKEDKTKNCGLKGEELDDNFFNLKSDLIKSAYWENDVFILERVSGDIIAVSGITDGMTKDLDIKYDKEQGALVVTMNGATTLVTGFTTSHNHETVVYSDNSLNGNGNIESPLSLSPLAKTGQYKPAFKLVDTTKGEKLPDCKTLAVGDRYVTIENISDFGYLYNYNSISKISSDLRDACSPWRVPTKEDWDNMLNAVEPRMEDRNHDKVLSNKYLGRFAGKLLKTVNFWRLESNIPDCDDICYDSPCHEANNNCYSKDIKYNVGCEEIDPYCQPICGEYKSGCGCRKTENYPNRGIDKYGFAAVPAGYGDDGDHIGYFGERGWYWTATNSQCLNAYTKRFEYDKSMVFQEIIGVNNLLSLRLVKDYDGANYNERESILGSDYSTVLMPSKTGKTIWTSTNIAFTNRYYNPVAPNNGVGLTYSKKFFVNEWTGKRWLKNELKDGESIVFKKAPSGGDNVEYRVINGAIVNVAETIYDDVIVEIRPELDSLKGMIGNEIIRAKEAERQLQSNIDSETARAVYAERQLQTQIDNLSDEDLKLHDLIEALDTKIEAETDRATAAEGALDDKIEAETDRATAAEGALDDKIDKLAEKEAADIAQVKNLIQAETDRAILAEMLLDDRIDTVDADLQGTKQDLLDEINRATAAEDVIRTTLNQEINRSIAKDNELETKINNEINRSIAKDNELESKINETDGKLDDEIARSTEQDRLITEKLLTKDGHTFIASEGSLKLKANNPDNNITIKLDFNFGTF